MSRDDPQMKLRLPPELRVQVEEAAMEAGRSLNAEIVARLEETLENDSYQAPILINCNFQLESAVLKLVPRSFMPSQTSDRSSIVIVRGNHDVDRRKLVKVLLEVLDSENKLSDTNENLLVDSK